jgi:hypothetical protein
VRCALLRSSSPVRGVAVTSSSAAMVSNIAASSNRPLIFPPLPEALRVTYSSLVSGGGRSSGSSPSWSSISTSCIPQVRSSVGVYNAVFAASCCSIAAHCCGVSRSAARDSATRATASTWRRLALPAVNIPAVCGSRAGNSVPSKLVRVAM